MGYFRLSKSVMVIRVAKIISAPLTVLIDGIFGKEKKLVNLVGIMWK